MIDIEVERICDMRAGYKLHVLRSGVDGDIHISVMSVDDRVSFQDVEFCASASQSPNTFKALCELVKAMQKDAEERPQG
ncbi:hypothetical protein [Rheinheimera sp.]|uniref:hypothetical protein n=1 Tax=Rheinheimera sp. TaxID=1869214 RepID=UPI0040481455